MKTNQINMQDENNSIILKMKYILSENLRSTLRTIAANTYACDSKNKSTDMNLSITLTLPFAICENRTDDLHGSNLSAHAKVKNKEGANVISTAFLANPYNVYDILGTFLIILLALIIFFS